MLLNFKDKTNAKYFDEILDFCGVRKDGSLVELDKINAENVYLYKPYYDFDPIFEKGRG